MQGSANARGSAGRWPAVRPAPVVWPLLPASGRHYGSTDCVNSQVCSPTAQADATEHQAAQGRYHDLHRDVPARRRTRRGQPRPGLPGLFRAAAPDR
ncbi:hypothetical protein G6F58_013503 [Rhizopus delemar]|nr:hypothetical protein G6F58_013503 [Rhizopus delemar]